MQSYQHDTLQQSRPHRERLRRAAAAEHYRLAPSAVLGQAAAIWGRPTGRKAAGLGLCPVCPSPPPGSGCDGALCARGYWDLGLERFARTMVRCNHGLTNNGPAKTRAIDLASSAELTGMAVGTGGTCGWKPVPRGE